MACARAGVHAGPIDMAPMCLGPRRRRGTLPVVLGDVLGDRESPVVSDGPYRNASIRIAPSWSHAPGVIVLARRLDGPLLLGRPGAESDSLKPRIAEPSPRPA